jgi:hypothetical protein
MSHKLLPLAYDYPGAIITVPQVHSQAYLSIK